MTISLTRRQWLWGTGAAAALAATLGKRGSARAAVTAPPKNFIYLTVFGGWDTSYALDPKPAGGDIDVPPGGTIVSHGNLDIYEDPTRPAVGEFFARYASITALVRGIRLNGVSHDACMQAMLTGARDETSPDLAAIVANVHAPELPVPYLVLGDAAFAGPYAASMGRVGPTNQIAGLLGPRQAYPVDGIATPFVPRARDEETIRAYQVARATRDRAVRGATGYNKRRIDDFVASLGRGDRLREIGGALGPRGQQLDLAAQRTLAIDAIETGISRSVTISSQLLWDTHDNNAAQGASHQALFTAVTSLVADLEDRNMLDDTVVAVVSEMGRTPKLNSSNGKDHWPVTTAMVIGGGIRGGRAYGATTDGGEADFVDFTTGDRSPAGRTIEAKHFVAGLAAACGIDPAVHFPEAEPFGAFVA